MAKGRGECHSGRPVANEINMLPNSEPLRIESVDAPHRPTCTPQRQASASQSLRQTRPRDERSSTEQKAACILHHLCIQGGPGPLFDEPGRCLRA